MTVFNRALLRLFLAVVWTLPALAQSHPETARIANLRLWPGTAPGSENAPAQELYQTYNDNGSRYFWQIARPMMTAFFSAKPNGAAVMVIPGGGYRAVYFDSGVEIARWFNSIGVDAFVLKYRLPDEGHFNGFSVPLQDAQRALRLIRSGAALKDTGHSLNANRIGVLGLSAGGNLAAVLATYHDRKTYEPLDESDAVSARPDFMVLGYAVLPRSFSQPNDVRTPNISRLYRTYVVGLQVNATTPPAFIYAGDRDKDVPYAESVRFAGTLRDAGVPVELHIFAGAGHGFVMGKGEERAWPDLCSAWLKARGIIP